MPTNEYLCPRYSYQTCSVRKEMNKVFGHIESGSICVKCFKARFDKDELDVGEELSPLILYFKDDQGNNQMKIAETPEEICEAFEQELHRLKLV